MHTRDGCSRVAHSYGAVLQRPCIDVLVGPATLHSSRIISQHPDIRRSRAPYINALSIRMDVMNAQWTIGMVCGWCFAGRMVPLRLVLGNIIGSGMHGAVEIEWCWTDWVVRVNSRAIITLSQDLYFPIYCLESASFSINIPLHTQSGLMHYYCISRLRIHLLSYLTCVFKDNVSTFTIKL